MASISIGELDRLQSLILHAVGAARGGSADGLHLQMTVFQTMKILKEDPVSVGYGPSRLGPFSDEVRRSAESLELLGFLERDGGAVRIADSAGPAVAGMEPLPGEAGWKVATMAEFFSRLEDEELLLMMRSDDLSRNGGRFFAVPDASDDVLRERVRIAVGMYRAGKVSLERASELADIGIRELQDMLIERYGAVYVDRGRACGRAASRAGVACEHVYTPLQRRGAEAIATAMSKKQVEKKNKEKKAKAEELAKEAQAGSQGAKKKLQKLERKMR